MGETVTSALTAGFTAVQTNIMEGIGLALPVGLGIMGTVMAIKFGIKFFKGTSKAS